MNNPKTTLRLGNRTGSNGGADPDRTGDPLLAKQVLSQLSYSPENLFGDFPPFTIYHLPSPDLHKS